METPYSSLRQLARFALFEHIRTTLRSELRYLEVLKRDVFDEGAFSDMLIEFGVKRTLSKNGYKALCSHIPTLAEKKRNGLTWKEMFEYTAPDSEFCPLEGSKVNAGFVSGLTKALWFTGGHQGPMFDKFTAAAVGARGKNTTERAIDFYKKIDVNYEFAEARNSIGKIDNLPTFFSAERFLDKMLFFRGMERQNQRHVFSGLSTENGDDSEFYFSTRLLKAADRLFEVVDAQPFGKKIVK